MGRALASPSRDAPVDDDIAMSARSRHWSPRRLWWTLFLLLSGACLAWALSSPLFVGPDEIDHSIRATAVVRGQMVGSAPSGLKSYLAVAVRTPEAYTHAGEQVCYIRNPALTPKCAPPFTGGHRLARAYTDEHRSLPPYYAIVGLPTLIWTSTTGFYLMRVISALMCAALLASAFLSARDFPSPRFGVLGVAIATTPEVLFLSGLVNSNALEGAAAICFWSSLLALALRARPPSSHLIVRTTVAFTALVACRGLSLFFTAIALAAFAVVAGGSRLRELAADRRIRVASLIATLAGIGAAGWTVFLLVRYPIVRTGTGLSHAFGLTGEYLRQAVGVFNTQVSGLSARNNPLPILVYWAWGIALLLVLAAVVATARRRHTIVVVALLAVAIIIPITATGANIPPIGLAWWGRYGLPLWAGVTITAGAVIDPRAPRFDAWIRRLHIPTVAFALMVLAQGVAFTAAVRRFGVGVSGPVSPAQFLFNPVWSPPTGPAVLYLAIFGLSLAALALLLVRRTPLTRSG